MKRAFLVLTLAAMLSVAAVSANASPASHGGSANTSPKSHGGYAYHGGYGFHWNKPPVAAMG
jgi:hypothetical protein